MATEISEETARFLVSESGQQMIGMMPTLGKDLAEQLLALRKRGTTPDTGAAAVEVASARKRARLRFPDADRLFFTGDALAQATSPGIARYHAACLAPLGTVVDIGCGVGMDSIWFAEAGLKVVALERDAARLVFARANADACGVSGQIRFCHADATAVLPLLDGIAGLYADPSRRDGGKRHSREAAQYDPPLSLITELARNVSGGCVKLSPALPDDILDGFARSIGGRIEFLSEGRECKEACVLWRQARGAGGDLPRAVVLLPERLAIEAGQAAPIAAVPPVPGSFALDPDPALIRADALGAVAGAWLISPDDAYLQSDVPPAILRLASTYRIEAVVPYAPRRVGDWLKTAGYGRLIVKKRHFPKEPDALARELKLPGRGREITLILVRTGPSHLAILCHPV